MKTAIFLIANTAIAVNTFATVRTVSNYPPGVGQFSTIQAAIDVSSSGDTIYVHGSPNAYASFTINNKQLVVMGPGWAPDKDWAFTAKVQGGTIIGSGSSNTEIQGIAFTVGLTISSSHPDNLRFIRNQFSQGNSIDLSQGGTTYQGYTFEGNVFNCNGISANAGSTYKDFVFRNNHFYAVNSGCGSINGFSNSVNVLFDHNVWFAGSNAGCFSGCQFLTITNNVFVARDAASGNSFSTFNNNITFNAGNNTPWLSNGNLDAGGNIANQDPQIVDQGSSNPLGDFTIAAGPANNAGSDGKDMGLLYDTSGSLNWTNSRNSRLPRVTSMSITNPIIPAGGTLNVEVEGKKSN